jgi:hypothetical protein
VIIRDSYNYMPRERYIERRSYRDWDDGPRAGVGFRAPGVGVGVGNDLVATNIIMMTVRTRPADFVRRASFVLLIASALIAPVQMSWISVGGATAPWIPWSHRSSYWHWIRSSSRSWC